MKNRFVVPALVAVTTLAFTACSAGPRASTSSTTSTTGAPTTTVAASPTTVPPAPGSFAALMAACAPGVDASTFGEILGALKPAPAADASFTTLDYINQLTELVPSNPYWVLGISDGIKRGSCLVAFQKYMPKAPPQGGGTGNGSGTNSHGGSGGTGPGQSATTPPATAAPVVTNPVPVTIAPASTDAPVYTVPPAPTTPPTAAPVTTQVPAPTATDPPTVPPTTAFTGTVVCDENGCHTEG